jgi:hypothetical protein
MNDIASMRKMWPRAGEGFARMGFAAGGEASAGLRDDDFLAGKVTSLAHGDGRVIEQDVLF